MRGGARSRRLLGRRVWRLFVPRMSRRGSPGTWLSCVLPLLGLSSFSWTKSVAGILSGVQLQKSVQLRPILQQAQANLARVVLTHGRAFVAEGWAQWVSRWQNKAADAAANKAMDREESFHWVADRPCGPRECILAYADGGCRAPEGLAIGPGAAACVLVASVPGEEGEAFAGYSALW